MRGSKPAALFVSVVGVCVSIMLYPAQAKLPEGLVAYYKLNAVSGLTALDETGQHDGTLTDSLAWVAGIDGNALQFKGGNGSAFVDLGAWQTDGPEGLSLCIWAKWAGGNGLYQGLISQREGTMYWWSEMPPDSSTVRFKSNTNPQSMLTIANGVVVEDEWAHLAFSHDAAAGTGVIYLNGEEYTRGDWSLPAGDFSALRTGIGVVNTGDGLGTFNGVLDEAMIFDVPLSAEDVVYAMDGFTDPTASGPTPADGETDVPRDGVLGWRPGKTAIAHDVYFGTSFDEISTAERANPMGVLLSEAQDANSYDPDGLLEFGQTYYWRIDEVNEGTDGTIFKGDVWNFTAEAYAYAIDSIAATTNATSSANQGLDNTIDGSGLNASDQHSVEADDMWLGMAEGDEPVWIQYEFDRIYKLYQMLVWNYNVQFELALGFGLKDVTIEYSVDGVDWTVLGDMQFAQGTTSSDYAANTTVDFGGVPAQHVRITVNSKWGTLPQCGLSEVRFYQIPTSARDPQPASGATEVSVDAALSWRSGRGAVSHEVYFGTDQAAVADGTSEMATVATSEYTPAELALGTTYYWTVTEVNDADTINSWEGGLWSFSTQAYLVVDDFEGYNDEDNVIYETWIDGWINGTGSTVGYLLAPFAEQSVVNNGLQSMPLAYDNTVGPYYSEAELALGSADWTTNGADTLRLFFQGSADNTADTLYVAVEDSAGQVAVATYADAEAVLIAEWQEWVIPYASLTDAGVNLAKVDVLYIGLGDRDNPAAGGAGLVFIDDVSVGHPATGQ